VDDSKPKAEETEEQLLADADIEDVAGGKPVPYPWGWTPPPGGPLSPGGGTPED
jgi:hypothetical protein